MTRDILLDYEYICSIGDHSEQGMIGTITVGDGCTSGIYDCAGVCDGDAIEDCSGYPGLLSLPPIKYPYD